MTRGRRRWVVLLGLFVVSGALMLVLWPDSPGDIVDFELAGDEGAPVFLDAWTGWDGPRVVAVLLLDLPFLVAYGLGAALVLDAVAGWSTGRFPRWSTVLGRGRWLPIAAAGFDVVENALLLVVVSGRTDGWPDAADSAASIKFALIYGAYPAVLLAALGTAGVARWRRRAS